MKKPGILLLFLLFCHLSNAQDYILKKNGQEIYGSVKEISPSEIKYADTLQPGVLRVINKSEVFMIKFRNGIKEIYGVENNSEVKKQSAASGNYNEFEGPIEDLGSNDYSIQGRIYHFSQIKRLLLSIDDPQINRLLLLARLEGIFGNILAYSSIPIGLVGLAIISDGFYESGTTVAALSLLSICAGSNAANIVFKIDKRKKISEAIALYNKKVEAQSTTPQ